MPEYVAVKLKNGKDLVGIILHDEREFVTIDSPLEISVHPVHGRVQRETCEEYRRARQCVRR